MSGRIARLCVFDAQSDDTKYVCMEIQVFIAETPACLTETKIQRNVCILCVCASRYINLIKRDIILNILGLFLLYLYYYKHRKYI